MKEQNLLETVSAKSIVNRVKKPGAWFGIEYNMNLYRGCCHGCIYCDSRSDCYRIDDFDQVKVKANALELVRDDLRRHGRARGLDIRPGSPGADAVVGTGAMSDPYNPFEERLEYTRHALELVDAFEFGAAIATKSSLIVRDADLLQQIREHSPVLCKITVTTADDELSSRIEPGVCTSSQRFSAVAKLADQGIFTGILLMPILPFLEDSKENVLAIVRRAQECGARFIFPAFGMTLRENQRDWYFKKLEELFPGQGLPQRYVRRYGNSYTCRCSGVKTLQKEFVSACEEAGLLYRMKDIIFAYKAGYEDRQLHLF